MNRIVEKMKQNKSNGLLFLSTGTVLSQGINLLMQPILTRLITPEELGLYSYIFSIANLFIPVASLKLYILIVTAEDDEEAKEVAYLSIVSIIFVILLYILIVVSSSVFSNHTPTEYKLLLTINPLIIFTSGLYYVFLSMDNRYRKYQKMAKAEISKVGILGLLQIVSGILNFGVVGLLVSRIFSPLYFLSTAVQNLDKNKVITNIKHYFSRIKKYRKHIFYSVPSQFINSFSYTLIMLSIISLFSSEEVGYYSIAMKVLGIPLVLISNNLGKIYLQKISGENRSSRSLFAIFKKTTFRLITVSLLLFAVIVIASPFATEMIFGYEYADSGNYIIILSYMFAFRFITSSLVGTYVVIKKQHIELYFQIILIIVGVFIYIISTIFSISIYHYLILVSMSYGLVYLTMLINIGKECKRFDQETKRL